MPLPESFKVKSQDPVTYSITKEHPIFPDREVVVQPTVTADGHRLVFLEGSGLDTWGVKKDVIEPIMEGGKAALAVLDKDNKLVAIALGEMADRGRSDAFVLTGIQYNDGVVQEFEQKRFAALDRTNPDTKVTPSAAQIVTDLVVAAANHHEAQSKAKQVMVKLPVEDVVASETLSLPHFSGKTGQREIG